MAAVLIVWGCGGGASPEVADASTFQKACAEMPGCREPRFTSPGPVETIWRVVIVREALGGVRIGRVVPLKVSDADGVPVGPLAGSHLLVGLDGAGKPVDGQLIRFPEALRLEFAGGRFVPEDRPREIDLSGRKIETTGYVRALSSIERLAVLDDSGVVIATASVPKRPALAESSAFLRLSGIAPMHSNLVRGPFLVASWGQDASAATLPDLGDLPPYCAHVLFLQEDDDRNLARGLAEDLEKEFKVKTDIRLLSPGPAQRAVVYGALGLMTPLLCQSVSQIAFFEIEPYEHVKGAVNMAGTGDVMMLNASYFSEHSLTAGESTEERRTEMLKTILHESGHSAESLLNAQGNGLRHFGDWDLSARTLASRTIDRVRLAKGLRVEWERVHESFQAKGWAQDYPASWSGARQLYGWSSQQISEAGFMSSYGGSRSKEDIAEFVGWTYLRGTDSGSEFAGWSMQDSACKEMNEYRQKDVPSRLAAVYTKLLFLKDLGLVAAEDVKACTGPDLGLPLRSTGFHFWHAGNELRSFTGNVTAAIGTASRGDSVFEMKAEGEAAFGDGVHPATLRLQLDLESGDLPIHEVSWPRGVYRLGLFGNNRVQLRIDGARAGNFDVKNGFALIAEASEDRIAGSIFITVAMRLSAPLPVPQTWNPPLIIRFSIEK